MDWNKITDTLNPYLNKAKEYWQKVVKFTENQIQTTPLFIKNQADYDELLIEKRVIIIAYEDREDIAKEIRLLSSVWLTKAFMDAAKLRFISISDSGDFARNSGFIWPLDMRVRFEWQETLHITDLSLIKEWWQSPHYKKWDSADASEHVSVDPLAGK